jgi:Vesicle transport v-SNARE protein N-terminus
MEMEVMNIPNTQRSKVSSRLRNYKSTLEKTKAAVVYPFEIFETYMSRKELQNHLLEKHYLGLVIPIKELILKLRIINELVFYLERIDLNGLHRGYEILNG